MNKLLLKKLIIFRCRKYKNLIYNLWYIKYIYLQKLIGYNDKYYIFILKLIFLYFFFKLLYDLINLFLFIIKEIYLLFIDIIFYLIYFFLDFFFDKNLLLNFFLKKIFLLIEKIYNFLILKNFSINNLKNFSLYNTYFIIFDKFIKILIKIIDFFTIERYLKLKIFINKLFKVISYIFVIFIYILYINVFFIGFFIIFLIKIVFLLKILKRKIKFLKILFLYLKNEYKLHPKIILYLNDKNNFTLLWKQYKVYFFDNIFLLKKLLLSYNLNYFKLFIILFLFSFIYIIIYFFMFILYLWLFFKNFFIFLKKIKFLKFYFQIKFYINLKKKWIGYTIKR